MPKTRKGNTNADFHADFNSCIRPWNDYRRTCQKRFALSPSKPQRTSHNGLSDMKSYAYRVGALQGAVRIALIHLKYGRTEDAARTLREVLIHVGYPIVFLCDDAKNPERTEQ
jgi:hypothetical protein